MTTENLLVEIGTEELPPKALKSLAQAFADNFAIELQQADLSFDKIEWFASPRRLAFKVTALLTEQPSKEIEKRGPPVSQAFDADGNPTKAAVGWAAGCGIDISQAQRIQTDKGEWLVHTAFVAGTDSKTLIVDYVNNALAKLPIPKAMRWGDKTVQFVRPVHTATVLFGSDLLDGEILGIKTDRILHGHRFMGQSEVTIQHADEYPKILAEKGCVIADFNQRKELIRRDAEKAAAAIGGIADIEEDLLDEVTSLVEYPVVLTATFEKHFLAVPSEALVYTMKGDQKYFPVYDKQGNLLPNFIFVTNINPQDPTNIITGNEKVVRPRLADAEFFFNTDLKKPLVELLPRLETVMFQNQLGTLREKTERIAELSAIIAEKIGANIQQAKRAGLLSKCDLMTNMVFEFTDTQGIMGMHYARHNGEDEEVAVALNEQYKPRFAGDELPNSLVACSVALADKLDTITGIFGIGQAPKSDKDPFALRRASLGVLRIIIEKNLSLDLTELVQAATKLYADKLTNKNVVTDAVEFILGRCPAWYQDNGFSLNVINAVMALKPTAPADFDARIRAVDNFRNLAAAESLSAANKRVSNILAKVQEPLSPVVDTTLLIDPYEKELATQVTNLSEELTPLFAKRDYNNALLKLAALQEPVNNFFDNVMVNVEDVKLRNNRLALLNNLRNLFLQIADISLLQ